MILLSGPRSGAISMARAGQVMLSIAKSGARPKVTLKSACVRAELRTPASARLRVIHAA